MHLEELKKQEQIQPKPSKRRKVMNIGLWVTRAKQGAYQSQI